MAATAWQVQGQYYENCNCDFVCPCVPGQMTVKPTKDSCTFVMAYQIERGRFGDTPLDGLGFVVVGVTPAEMAKGNWSVGVIVDERANAEQRDAIAGIASGAAGGPMAALSGLVGKFLGVESAAIAFQRSGDSWSVKAGDKLRLAGRAAKGLNPDEGGAEIVYYETASGGAAFSVGSIVWPASLLVDEGVSRITENVVRRFIGEG